MSNKLVTNKTVVRSIKDVYVISQTKSAALYASILAGTTPLPNDSIIELVPTSGTTLVKLSGKGSTWLTAFAIGSGAVSSKPEVAALTAVATADGSDPATTQALANALKVKVNAIIAALKA